MRLYVPLSRDEYDRLLELAQAERRRPQDQAALILVRSLGLNQPGTSQASPTNMSVAGEPSVRDAAVEALAR